MFSNWKIVCIAASTVALLTTTVGAQDPASPYGAAPAGGTTAPTDPQAGAAGSGSAGASAPAPAGAAPSADPSAATGSAATGSTGAGTADATAGMDATAGAGIDAAASAPQPVKKGPSASWLAAQNRASAKLREEQLSKMKGSAEPPSAPANPPATQ